MKIELPDADWQLIINVLARSPYNEVANVIAAIGRQAAEQQQQKADAP